MSKVAIYQLSGEAAGEKDIAEAAGAAKARTNATSAATARMAGQIA